jgi:nucleolar complex protein 3
MDSDDEPLSADDIAFFKKRSSSASFLMRDQGIDPDRKDKTQKKREQEREEAARKKERARLDQLQGRGKDDDGEDEGPRRSKHWLEEEENERKQGLPVKMADGSVKKVMREHALPDPDTVEEEPAMSKRARKRARGELVAEKKARERGEVYIKPGSAPPQAEEKAETGQLAAAAPEKKGKGKLGGSPAAEDVKLLTHDEKKIAIADICSKLMHNPEQHMSSLTRLHHFCNDTDASIAKLAMISQAMVFADILPDYRIRLPTEKEKEMKVSKEVAQQRAFEAAMLGGYQRFLQASNMLCEM